MFFFVTAVFRNRGLAFHQTPQQSDDGLVALHDQHRAAAMARDEFGDRPGQAAPAAGIRGSSSSRNGRSRSG